jgi:hypothetical protein
MEEEKTSTAGFEPAQDKPNRFQVCLLNHSDISTSSLIWLLNANKYLLLSTYRLMNGNCCYARMRPSPVRLLFVPSLSPMSISDACSAGLALAATPGPRDIRKAGRPAVHVRSVVDPGCKLRGKENATATPPLSFSTTSYPSVDDRARLDRTIIQFPFSASNSRSGLASLPCCQ